MVKSNYNNIYINNVVIDVVIIYNNMQMNTPVGAAVAYEGGCHYFDMNRSYFTWCDHSKQFFPRGKN